MEQDRPVELGILDHAVAFDLAFLVEAVTGEVIARAGGADVQHGQPLAARRPALGLQPGAFDIMPAERDPAQECDLEQGREDGFRQRQEGDDRQQGGHGDKGGIGGCHAAGGGRDHSGQQGPDGAQAAGDQCGGGRRRDQPES